MFGINSKSYPISISTIMPCIGLCSCRGIVWTIHALASSTPITPFDETMRVFRLLHLLVEVDLPPFVDDFHPKRKIILDQQTFISALARPPHFSSGGPLGMCMNFYKIILFQMILRVASTSFSRYVGTSFKVMFHFNYCVCFLHLNF